MRRPDVRVRFWKPFVVSVPAPRESRTPFVPVGYSRCVPGRHIVRDGRVTCDCQGTSVTRDPASDDVVVMVYNEGG